MIKKIRNNAVTTTRMTQKIRNNADIPIRMLKKIRNNADTTTRIKVETFRIINNIDKVNSNKIFPKNEKTTKGHKHAIYKKHCITNIRKYSFSQRVVDTWNSLPAKVIESNTVNGFNNQLNSHWKDLEIKFKPDIYKPL